MKPHIRIVFVLTFVLFIVNKFSLRPWILEHTENSILHGFVYSIPNFCEAVMGVTILTHLGLYARRSIKRLSTLSHSKIYTAASLIAMIYILTQEYGLHNLGGNNTYDPIDVLASIFGIFFIMSIIAKTGFDNQKDTSI